MISLHTAHQLLSQHARHWGNEIIWLDEAVGRVLAEPLVADRDYPPFRRATMDGIAIRFADWEKGLRHFRVRETLYAGSIPSSAVAEGACYRIMTGAAVPESTDTVIRKEDLSFSGEAVTLSETVIQQGQHIAPQGSDTAAGTTLLQPHVRIRPGTLTTLAALGYAEVKVARLPSVAILTTGNEIVPVDSTPGPVQVRNSNASLLNALLALWNIQPAVIKHLPDDPARMLSAVKQLLHIDILIFNGAVSAGDADHVPQVLQEAGIEQVFHKVAIRPGKPAWFGQKKGGPVVFALPGNPFSTFVTFHFLISYYLRSCWGLPPATSLQLPFDGTRSKKSELDEFFPVSIHGNPSRATALPFNTSGDITAVLQAVALGWHPAAEPALSEGTVLECYLV